MAFEKFEIKCKNCGSTDISIIDKSERHDDGDGIVDVIECLVLRCNSCKQEEAE